MLQLARIPAFLPDLYLNFDCGLYTRDVFEAVVKFLGHHAYPEERGLFTTNLIALDALLSVIHEIEGHGSEHIHYNPMFVSPLTCAASEGSSKHPAGSAVFTLEQANSNKKAKLLLEEGQ